MSCSVSIFGSSRAACSADRTLSRAALTWALVRPGTSAAACTTMPSVPLAKSWAGVPANGPAGPAGLVFAGGFVVPFADGVENQSRELVRTNANTPTTTANAARAAMTTDRRPGPPPPPPP